MTDIVYAVSVNGSYGYNIFQNSLNIIHNAIFWSTTCEDTLHQVPAPPNGMRPSRYPWPRVASACACGRWLQGVAPPRDPPYAPDICKRLGIGSELWGSTEDLPKYLPRYLSESHSRSGWWISHLFHAVLCLATDLFVGLPSGDWISKETHGETHGETPILRETAGHICETLLAAAARGDMDLGEKLNVSLCVGWFACHSPSLSLLYNIYIYINII